MTPDTPSATFDLAAFDLAEYLVFGPLPIVLTLDGVLGAGGAVGPVSFTSDGINDGGFLGPAADFEAFLGDLSAFTELASVTFSGADLAGNPAAFGIDNLNVTVNTTPEPGSVLLLGMGLVLSAACRRRLLARRARG
jgi:hypothetical protein